MLDLSDDERSRSPGLQAVTVKYTPPASPPPFVPRRRPMTEPGSESQQQSRKRGRGPNGRRVRPSQGDVVLLGHLAPDRPDIAALAGKQTFLPSDSASERGGTADDDDDDSRMDEAENQSVAGSRTTQQSTSDPHPMKGFGLPKVTPGLINGDNSSFAEVDAEMADAPHETAASRSAGRGDSCLSAACTTDAAQRIGLMTDRPEPGLHQPHDNCSSRVDAESSGTREFCYYQTKSPINLPPLSESISASPKLAPHIMTAPQRSPSGVDHPPRAGLSSPGTQEQSLPPVHHLVRMAETQDEALFRRRPRTASLSSVSSALAPSASSYTTTTAGSGPSTQSFGIQISQPPISSLTPLGRTATDPTPLPLPNPSGLRHTSTNPAEFAMHSSTNAPFTHRLRGASSTGSTSTAGATPSSLHDAPTPSDRSSTTLSLPVSPEQSTHALANSQISVSGGTTAYKCNHPGCRAQPFQTPYLLNSHRNVHSSDRPYFCPRKDCPRSQPGRGFKRKNEMLRHGLVHDSPGYVCPFCSPEKEHRYPRPDNLQRHVKMHHEDVDPEDPRLREVLGQRRTTIAAVGSSNVAGSSARRPTLVAMADTGDGGSDRNLGYEFAGPSATARDKEAASDALRGPDGSAAGQRKYRRKGTSGGTVP